MTPYINIALGYYEAADDIRLDDGDVQVPQRPSASAQWDGSAWKTPIPPAAAVVQQAVMLLEPAVQAYLDAQARAMGYDSIHTAVTYADEPAVPRFQAEGQALRAWRSEVWAACYTLFDQAKLGRVGVPDVARFLGLLPTFQALQSPISE